MNARTLVDRYLTAVTLITLISIVQTGCTNSDSKAAPEQGAYLASGGLAEGESATPDADVLASQPDMIAPQETHQSLPDQTAPVAPAVNPDRIPANDGELFSIATDENEVAPQAPLPQLPADLPPAKLIQVLDDADKDMQRVVTGRAGITDAQQARTTLLHFMKLKLDASRELMNHPEANPSERSEGARGELQALSHLAAVGDLKAAEELEDLANANVESDDPRLVADSRLVLMGFAIEALQNGKDESADQIIRYVDAIKNSELKPDIPAMMVMGQVRETLANYGHEDQAMLVRDTIIELFAGSPDPQIANMAGQLAGSVRFDAIDRLRGQAIEGEPVSAEQWCSAVETLIDESADLQTVKYLAGAALEFESRNLDELVAATFEVATDRFNDAQSATGREIQLAIRASLARAEVIGRVFDPEPAEGQDTTIQLSDYQGKVVMIPFWAAGFPDSLQLVARLKSIQAADPTNVAIVGLNLDADDAARDQFLQNNDLGFPSIHAGSSATDIAQQFGLVSFPFVAILDQKGHVAAINFTGYDLEKTVQELAQP